MKVTIYDYNNEPTVVEITKKVKSSVLIELSGDQCLYVEYEDGQTEWFDSSEDRWQSSFDGVSFVKLSDGLDLKRG